MYFHVLYGVAEEHIEVQEETICLVKCNLAQKV